MYKAVARIKKTFLGIEDHGLFTAYLDVDYGGSGQGIGLHALDGYDKIKKRRIGTAYGAEYIKKILWVCGTDRWEKLIGIPLYVLKVSDDWNAKVLGIQSLPPDGDRTFIFDELWEELGAHE